jgi:hypothetical protein
MPWIGATWLPGRAWEQVLIRVLVLYGALLSNNKHKAIKATSLLLPEAHLEKLPP